MWTRHALAAFGCLSSPADAAQQPDAHRENVHLTEDPGTIVSSVLQLLVRISTSR